MSYIAPSTNIRILRNCPLDNTYEHTLWFETKADQEAYFIGLTKYNLTEYTYQRLQRGRITVGIKADDLYDCNYIMYKNTGFGDKWFYGFITAVEYVNNNASTIDFELDVMQTWIYEVGTITAYVERQHTASDIIGDNIEPEPFNIDDLVYNDYSSVSSLNSLAVIIAVVDSDSNVNGHSYEGIFGGATLYAYYSNDVSGINAKLEEYSIKPEAIVNMYTCPTVFVSSAVLSSTDHIIPTTASGYKTTINKAQLIGNEPLDGYTPVNKKLYTYPYNYYLLHSTDGTELALRYEFFRDSYGNRTLTPSFVLRGTTLSPVQVMIEPTNYRNVPRLSSSEINLDSVHTERLILSDFPLCSWSSDSFKAWVAQKGIPLLADTAGSVAGALLDAKIAGTFGKKEPETIARSLYTNLTDTAINAVTNGVSGAITSGIAADISRGSFNSANVECAHQMHTFYGGRVSVNRVIAKMIDNYFTRFGYARNQIEYVDTHSRPHWNYVKTYECTIKGSIPADDANLISSIYNNGITFWKNAGDIGRYNLDNRPS